MGCLPNPIVTAAGGDLVQLASCNVQGLTGAKLGVLQDYMHRRSVSVMTLQDVAGNGEAVCVAGE